MLLGTENEVFKIRNKLAIFENISLNSMQNNRPHTNNSFPATFIPPFWQFLNFLKDLNGMKEITFTNTTSISKYFTCNIYIQLVKVYFGSATSVHPSFWHIFLPSHEPTEFVEASVASFLTTFASLQLISVLNKNYNLDWSTIP